MMLALALDTDLVDKLVELAERHRRNVESGATVPSQPVADELSDMDVILNALRGGEAPWPTDDMGREIDPNLLQIVRLR